MKKEFILKILILFAFIQCTSQVSNSSNIDNNILTIEGNNIWIREYPSTGDVLFKLNNGSICKVLKKDKKETIRGNNDFWYKIDYKGQIGWVFGNQTSIKLSRKVDKEIVLLPIKGYHIRYEKDLNIKVIDKVIEEDPEIEVRILFEYKYSEKKPSLIFVSKMNVPDPSRIHIFEKTMDLNELQKKLKIHFSYSMKNNNEEDNLIYLGGFEYNDFLLTKKEIFVPTSGYTSMKTTIVYNFDENGVISEIPQNEYFINKKTIALESFNFYETQSLKNIKGEIYKNENITIISTGEKLFELGGIFKIKSERGVTGWINIELRPDSSENKPKLKDIVTYIW